MHYLFDLVVTIVVTTKIRPKPYPKIDPWKEPAKLGSWDSYILPTAKKLGIDMTACISTSLYKFSF